MLVCVTISNLSECVILSVVFLLHLLMVVFMDMERVLSYRNDFTLHLLGSITYTAHRKCLRLQ